VGRHVPVKQFEVAIRAVALANEKAERALAELILVGDGPERANLEALAHSLPDNANTSFRGWLEIGEVHRELRVADALVVTSKFEPYAVVVLEAMAAARPVLTSDGVMAALDRDERSGGIRFHPVGDIDCLAEQIALMASDRETLRGASLAARATAENWPPSRAVTIIDEMLSSTKRGRTIVQGKLHNSGGLRDMEMAHDNCEPIEKSAVASGGIS
jgi:glycosyltransferase involved in cell wall biosynthesis